MFNTLFVSIFYQVPEGILMTIAGLGLFGIKTPKKGILATGVLYGLCIPIVRHFGAISGLHTLLLFAAYVLLMSWRLRVRLFTGIAAWLVAAVALTLGEIAVALPVTQSFGLDVSQTLQSPVQHVAWGWVSASILVIVAVIVWTTPFVLIQSPEREHSGRAAG